MLQSPFMTFRKIVRLPKYAQIKDFVNPGVLRGFLDRIRPRSVPGLGSGPIGIPGFQLTGINGGGFSDVKKMPILQWLSNGCQGTFQPARFLPDTSPVFWRSIAATLPGLVFSGDGRGRNSPIRSRNERLTKLRCCFSAEYGISDQKND